MLKRFLRSESGATVVEYGLIAAVLSLAILGGLSTVMNAIENNFGHVETIVDESTDQ